MVGMQNAANQYIKYHFVCFFCVEKKHMNEHREICCKPPFFAIFAGLP
ncbi:hypothetical protein M2133_002050 [Parabacteroides sp. PF5-6]|nr:hypothetical protein [Parabacteroides sp. PF5-6]